MKTFKSTLFVALALLLTALLGACAQEPPTTTPPSSGSTNYYVKTAKVSVKGQEKTVLVGKDGKTLYYFTSDTSTESKCTDSCATNWPPYVYNDSGKPTGDGLSGSLDVVKTVHGNQVYYNNHLLYYYAGDSASGQANGEGVGGKWYVATP